MRLKYWLDRSPLWQKMGRENRKYTREDLRRHVPQALASVPNQIIMAYNHHCLRKMDFYTFVEVFHMASLIGRLVLLVLSTNKDDDR